LSLVLLLSSPVTPPVPPGGDGTSSRLELYTPGSPVDPITSRLSLQYAYLNPSPIAILAKVAEAQMPVVTCAHVASPLALNSEKGSVSDLLFADLSMNASHVPAL